MATFKKYVISSGHGLYVRGASGYVDEVDEARKVVKEVTKLLKKRGCTVKEVHDNVSKTKAQNITNGRSSYIVKNHNNAVREIDISVHFNAFKKQEKGMGVEVLYVTNDMKKVASDLSTAIAQAGLLINRGAKKRTDLAFLNCTDKPAILIEMCFCDSKTDTTNYKKHFAKICEAIAKTLSGKSAPKPEPKPPSKPSKPSSKPSKKEEVIGTAKVICDSLNVRSKADFDSALAKGTNPVKKNSTHDVYEKKNGLYRIGKDRWISANTKYVKYTAKKKESFKVGSYQKTVKTKDDLNARSGRGTEFKVLGTFKKGTKVDVWYIDKAKNGSLWGSCSYKGKTAYINMGYVSEV